MPKPIPEGYHAVTPYLICRDASRAIAFYQAALGAKELFRFDAPGGLIGHAELQIGDSRIMLADEMPEGPWKSPQSVGGTPVSLMLYVENVDEVFQRAVSHGAKVIRDVQNQFYGDRCGTVADPFGHIWSISTNVEEVPMEELKRRAAEAMRQ